MAENIVPQPQYCLTPAFHKADRAFFERQCKAGRITRDEYRFIVGHPFENQYTRTHGVKASVGRAVLILVKLGLMGVVGPAELGPLN